MNDQRILNSFAASEEEATAIVQQFHPDAVIIAHESTDAGPQAVNYYDVLVWENQADSHNDAGARAIARYKIYAACADCKRRAAIVWSLYTPHEPVCALCENAREDADDE